MLRQQSTTDKREIILHKNDAMRYCHIQNSRCIYLNKRVKPDFFNNKKLILFSRSKETTMTFTT